MSTALTKQGAEILTYPSAFTVPTGLAHWEVGKYCHLNGRKKLSMTEDGHRKSLFHIILTNI